MKKSQVMVLGFLALSACASPPVQYSSSDSTSDGVRIALGSKDGLSEGETVRVLERRCKPHGKFNGCNFKTVGHLTILKVEGNRSSLAQVDPNIRLGENTFFDRESESDIQPTRPQKYIK